MVTQNTDAHEWGVSIDTRVAEAREFQEALWSRLRGYFERVSFKPDSERADERAFFPALPDDLRAMLVRSEKNGQNVLVGLATRHRKRGKRSDLRAAVAIRVDIDGDVDEIRARLATLPLPPSLVVVSGGGVHAYWLLAEVFLLDGEDARERFKFLMRGLARNVGGDEGGCATPGTLVRLPGSVNFPPKGKRERGRTPALVRLVECEPERRYEFDQLEAVVAAEIEAFKAEKVKRKTRPSRASDDGLTVHAVLQHLGLSETVEAVERGGRAPCPLCCAKNARVFAVAEDGFGWTCFACHAEKGEQRDPVALAAAYWSCGRGRARARLREEGAYGDPVRVADLVSGPTPDHPHEDLADVLRASLDARSAALVRSRIGKGKTHEALNVMTERDERFLVLVDDHTLGAEIVEKLQGKGVDAAKPLSIKEGCKNPEATRVLGLGWSRNLACKRCTLYPEGEGCPYIESVARTHEARVAVLPKVAAQDATALHRLLRKRDCLVVEEDATDFLARKVEFTPRDLKAFGDELRRLSLDEKASKACRAQLLALLGLLMDTLQHSDDAVVAVRSVPNEPEWDPTPILDKRAFSDIRRRLNARASERMATRPRRLPRNLLPLLREIAVRQDGGEAVLLLRRAKTGGFELRIRNRVPRRRAVWLLDATANVGLMSKLLGRALEIVGGGEPVSTVIFQATERTVWGRRYYRLLERQAQLDEKAVAEAAATVELIVRRTGWKNAGLVSFQGLVDPDHENGAPLIKAIDRRLQGEAEVEALWFGRLRGQNALKDADGVVVLGTPTPNPDDVRSRALLLGATAQDLRGDPVPLVVNDGRETFPCFTYRNSIMRRAWCDLVGAEIVQACGRGTRGARCVPVIFLLASALFEWSGRLVRDTRGGLGLAGTAVEVVDAALRTDEEAGREVGCKVIAKCLGRRPDDKSVKRALRAARRWRIIKRLRSAQERSQRGRDRGVRRADEFQKKEGVTPLRVLIGT
jgi:hypothetical protein